MTIQLKADISGFLVRWDEELALSETEAGVWPNRTIAQFAAQRAEQHPDRVQLIDGDRQLTCRELVASALALAQYFHSRGLRAGDVVSFQLPNWWEANVINLAAAFAGLVINPLVPILRDAEVSFILNDCGSRLVFIPAEYRRFDYRAMMERINAAREREVEVVSVRSEGHDDEVTIEDAIEAGRVLQAPLPDVDPNAVKLCMYTSGTTGRPKGVLHTHNTIHAENHKTAAAAGLTPDDVIFMCSTVGHVTGALYALNMTWYSDIPVVLMDAWSPEQAYELMARHRCSYMAGATPFLQGLVEVAERRGALPALRAFTCGGAGVPPSLIYRAHQIFPNCLTWRAYGATEVPTLSVGPRSHEELRHAAETDGLIWRARVKIVDPQTGDEAAQGAAGEILAWAPNMSLGYLRTEDNDDAYDEQGMFRTGDLGCIVDEHYIVITGRKKDLIIRGGENISAKEIEDVLIENSKIADVAVVAMPSARLGEAICAFIVPAGEVRIGMVEISDAIAQARLAKQKTPEHIEFVDELPRNAAGKVRKDELRATAAAVAARIAEGAA